MEAIKHYFPDLSEEQRIQFEKLGPLYKEWNQKINVISRKDIEQVYPHHILHSTVIAKFITFKPGAKILDLGTGGGLPGIPMAILFPKTQFLMIDGTRKKIQVVQTIIEELGLKNAEARHIRSEELKGQKFDFVICRAVASLDKLLQWSQRLISDKHQHIYPNGLITLKGGNIKAEIKASPRGIYVEMIPITDFFDLEYFKEKYIVYAQK